MGDIAEKNQPAAKTAETESHENPAAADETAVGNALASRAEAYLIDAIESITAGFALFDAEDRLVLCNNRYRDVHPVVEKLAVPGAKFEDMVRGYAKAGLFGGTKADVKDIVERRMAYHRNTPSSHEHQLTDGRWVEIRESKTHDGGTVLLWTNISDRKRSERMQKGRNRVLEELATGGSLEDVLALLITTAEEINPDMLGSVLLLDEDGKRLRTGAAPNLPDFFNQAVDGIRIGPKAGSCGAAAYTGETVIVEDVMTHPNWKGFRDKAKKAGLRACWSEPILLASGKVLGTFAMYYREPRKPTSQDLDLIQGAARVAGIAIEHKRMEQALRDSDDRLRGAVNSLKEGFALYDAEDRLVAFNDTFKRIRPAAEKIFEKGGTFEDLLRLNVKNGAIEEAIGREKDFIQERLKEHQTPHGGIVRSSQDGHWYLMEEARTPEGGIAQSFTDVTEIKNAEEALRESEERFRAVIESAPGAIVIKDLDGRNLIVNKTFCDWYGMKAEAIIGKTADTFLDKKTAKIIADQERHVAKTQALIEEERPVTYPDGLTRDVFVQKFPIFGPDGECVAIGTVVNDITERKQAEEALRESETLLREIVDHLPLGFYAKDLEGRHIVVNKQYLERYGLSEDQLIGKTNEEVFPENTESNKAAKEQEAEVISTKKVVLREQKKNYQDGTEHSLLVSKFPIMDAAGNVNAIGMAGVDVTEIKKANEALRRSEERFRDFSESASDWFWEMDENLRFTYFSDRFTEISGVKNKTLIGKTRQESGLDLNDEKIRMNIADLEAHRPFKDFVHRRTMANGDVAYMSTTGKPIFDANGDFKGYRGTGRDITNQVRAEEEKRLALVQAEEANQAKSEFLATISHELRTPLNAILGFAEILSHQYLGPIGEEKYIEYANDIHASGEYLLDLVNDVLDISTIEAGKRSLVMEPIPIREAIEECTKTVAGHSEKNGVKLSTRLPKNLPPLYADRRAVKQILLNVISNAIKFTPKGGKVSVSVKAAGGHSIIRVKDTGIGIPQEKIPSLKNPFERGNVDPYITQDGAGLGLAITHSLVMLHGGKLDIQSAPGKGTTVSVTLPNAKS